MSYVIGYHMGLPINLPPSVIRAEVNQTTRQVVFEHYNVHVAINFEDITSISFDEQSHRSVGKAATGAIVGGVLTGGIGLIAGAALGAKAHKNKSLFIGYKVGHIDAVAQFGGSNINPLYAEIMAAIVQPEPPDFDREYLLSIPPPAPKDPDQKDIEDTSLQERGFLLAAAIIIGAIILYFITQ